MRNVVKCPDCKKTVELEEEIEVGEVTECPLCYAGFKIIKINPIKIKKIENAVK